MSEALVKKLYLSKYQHITLANLSEHSVELQPLLTKVYHDNCVYDVIFFHAYTVDEMANYLLDCWKHQRIAVNGVCYLVYPKLKNKHYTGIHRDSIFPALQVDDANGFLPGTRYKFNRMVSLNDTFTIIGIKHVDEKFYQKQSLLNKNLDASKI